MLRYYFNAIGKPEKRKIITRERAYHGVTVAAGSLTSLPANLAHFDPPLEALGILRTDHPHYYRGAIGGETEAEFVDRITGNLEQLILAGGSRYHRHIYRRTHYRRQRRDRATCWLLRESAGDSGEVRHLVLGRRGHYRLWPDRKTVRL